MDDREQADAIARELVAARAFRWVAGMAFRYRDSRGDGRKYGPWHTGRMSEGRDIIGKRDHPPDLLDEATAALLAVQAMEAGIELAAIAPGTWWARMPGQPHGVEGPLGIVAARALIALGGGR